MRYEILTGSHISFIIPHLGLLARVNEFFKLFAGLEIGDTFCGDIDGGARLRIAALTRITLADAEAAKASQLDLFAFVQRSGDAVKNDLDEVFGVLFGHVRVTGDFFNQVSFCHFTFFSARLFPDTALIRTTRRLG